VAISPASVPPLRRKRQEADVISLNNEPAASCESLN